MTTTADELREEVRRRYAESARAVIEGTGGCGCGNGACCSDDQVVAEVKFGELLYDAEQRGELPDAEVAVAELNKRETVLCRGTRGRRLRGDLGRVHAPGRRRHAQRDREGRPVIQLVRPHPVRE